ncbi:LLM class flavin-dependent oxidoreductase [Actinocrispum sp. NPDC049592]|uniref:LLM class flavin-dependent oxidoreductase n=1 Tax=Actinocrispum sp. NPDC049592 TaxID=3154835 RepID=UPI0034193336
MQRRLGFGAGGLVAGRDPAQLLDLAQSADELGFELFSLSDHLHGTQPSADPWTTLSWLAGQTRTIKLGGNVFALPYRHPAVLAKMAATFDQMAPGRLVLGLGAGGHDHEFTAFGLPVRTPGGKIGAQREAIAIMRRLWTGDETTFEGRHFTVRSAQISPKAGPIPIWLGSHGPNALALTGQVADGWLPSLNRVGLGQAVVMLERVRAGARAAGRDPDELRIACNLRVNLGHVPSLVDQLRRVAAAGFTLLSLDLGSVEDQEFFAAEVMPQVSGM